MSIKAVLYARFSPRPNAAECESCRVQLVDLRRYAAAHDLQEVAEFHDDALSGADSWESRPGMTAAYKAIKRGMVFLVAKYDRLFRDALQGLAFAGLIEAKGAKVLSIGEEAASLNTPEARLMRTIFFAIGQYTRETGNVRTGNSMRYHQSNGRRMGRRDRCPFGFRASSVNPEALERDEKEQAVIAQIVHLRATGESWRSICEILDREGIRRRGKTWDGAHSLVARIASR